MHSIELMSLLVDSGACNAAATHPYPWPDGQCLMGCLISPSGHMLKLKRYRED